VNPRLMTALIDAARAGKKPSPDSLKELDLKIHHFYHAVSSHVQGRGEPDALAARAMTLVKSLLKPPSAPGMKEFRKEMHLSAVEWLAVMGWALTDSLGMLSGEEQNTGVSRSWIDELMLSKPVQALSEALGMTPESGWLAVNGMKIALVHRFSLFDPAADSPALMLCRRLFGDSDSQQALQVNRWQEVLYFNKEHFESLMRVIFTASLAEMTLSSAKNAKMKKSWLDAWKEVQSAESRSGYQVEKLLSSLETGTRFNPKNL
jgi:hypothetical protein